MSNLSYQTKSQENSPILLSASDSFKQKIDQVKELDLNEAEQTFITARTKEEAASANEHVNRVQELINAAQLILNSYKQEIQELREEQATIKPNANAAQNEIADFMKPKCQILQEQLAKGAKTQNEINKIFQLSITPLKKDDQDLQQEIIQNIERVYKQEVVLGKYNKN